MATRRASRSSQNNLIFSQFLGCEKLFDTDCDLTRATTIYLIPQNHGSGCIVHFIPNLICSFLIAPANFLNKIRCLQRLLNSDQLLGRLDRFSHGQQLDIIKERCSLFFSSRCCFQIVKIFGQSFVNIPPYLSKNLLLISSLQHIFPLLKLGKSCHPDLYYFLLLILSGDIELNPGLKNNKLNIISYNLNGGFQIAKKNKRESVISV